MSKIERGFVPIDEANTEKVRFKLDLPSYLDRAKIVANPDRIHGLMRLGGINYLRVETVEGDRVDGSLTIVGFDSQGEAYAGKSSSKTKTKEAETSDSKNSGSCSPVVDLLVKVDIARASSKVASRDVRSYIEWGNLLNQEVSRGINQAGNETLIKKNIRHDLIILSFVGGFGAADILTGRGDGIDAAEYYIRTSIIYNFLMNPIASLIHLGKHRLSLFIGPQLDRLAILQIVSRRRLIKGIDGE